MESPREVHESKAFRWVGHLSEEELLGGPPAAFSRPKSVSFQPGPIPAAATSPALPPQSADPLAVAPRWRFQLRDLIAVAAVGAAVGFALRGADGLPFRSSEAVEPATATELVTTNVALDRQQLRSLPRGTNAAGGNGAGVKGDRGGLSGSGSNHKPKPPPDDTPTSPLLHVTVPGVGTVTVDQPELPGETPLAPPADGPTLPDADQLLPQLPTVTLP